MNDENENVLPVLEVYRGVEIYGLQSAERVAAAKIQVDQVIAMSSPRALAAFASDDTRAPEARLLSKNKAMVSLVDRQGAPFDIRLLEAKTIGIERCTSQLGRLMGATHANWPRAWIEVGDRNK